VIPVFAWWFFAHVRSDFDRKFQTSVERSIQEDVKMSQEEKSKLLEVFRKVPLSRMLATGDEAVKSMVSADGQMYYTIFRWMIRISAICVLSGVLVFIVGGISVLLSLRSQLAQYYSLSAGWYLLRIFSTAQVLMQGCLTVFLSYWVTAYWFNFYSVKLVGAAAILALCACAAIIMAIFKKVNDDFEIEGCVVERTPDSPLWADLDRICKVVGTAPPDRIVAGIDNNFFVTEHPVKVDGKVYEGRTLFVSLSLLRVLQGSEADAVMAHEMAHFSGNDTLYSKKISPLLVRYGIYLEALHAGLSRPVFYFMFCFRGLYQASLGKLSKEREFRADKIASEVTSPRDIARSLLKIAAYSEYRGKVERQLFEAEKVLESVNISRRVETGFGEFAHAFVKEGNLAELQTAHPFDSHPPTNERWAAVGVNLTPEEMPGILKEQSDSRWYRNFGNAEELEQKQWAAYEEKFRTVHERVLAYRYVPDTEDEKAVVLKFFPGVTFEGKKQESLKLEHDKITFSGWEDPVLFSEIMTCTAGESAMGHPQLRVDFERKDKSLNRTFLMDLLR
jgi:Zn-dependent protease with chaperone function